MTHKSVNRLTITASDNGFSPGRRQAIIWTNAGILLIGPLGTNFSENLIEILAFSFTKMRLKVSSAKWRPFGLGLNVLRCKRYSLVGGPVAAEYYHKQWSNTVVTTLPSPDYLVPTEGSIMPLCSRLLNITNHINILRYIVTIIFVICGFCQIH